MNIFNIFLWVFNLDITDLMLLIFGIICAIYAIVCILAYFRNETPDEHFDKYTIPYSILFLLTVPLCLLTLIYKISVIAFIIFIVVGFVLLVAYGEEQRLYPEYRVNFISKYFQKRQIRIERRNALKTAKAFIKPYKSIIGKHILSNKYCQVIYNNYSKNNSFEFLCISTISDSNNYSYFEASGINTKEWNEDFFNSLCQNFSYKTDIHNLYNLFSKYNFVLNDNNYIKPKIKPIKSNAADKIKYKQSSQVNTINKIQNSNSKSNNVQANILLGKININNASEAELTALPGINLIQAKRAIHHRDFEGEFKSIDEFLSYLKIKPHFAKQLQNLITVENIKVKEKRKNKAERIIDLD